MDDRQRIYDSRHLSDLIEGLAVLKREFYCKASTGTYWGKSCEQEACAAGYDPLAGAQGVALLVCQKPFAPPQTDQPGKLVSAEGRSSAR